MKKLVLSIVGLLVAGSVYAQKVELSVNASTNLYHYSGNGTTATSPIITSPDASQNYTNNPYGNKNAWGFGLAGQAQYVTKAGFIAGLQAGFERVQSSVDITTFYSPMQNYGALPTVDGSTKLKSNYINLNPYIGYRIIADKFNIDLQPGVDVGFKTSMREKGSTGEGNVATTDRSREDKNTDFRLRMGIAAYYNRIGITAAYAHGLTNVKEDLIGSQANEAYSRLWRFGISYRLL
ncbi:PorT family protein [Mucilaginibacter pallidiroseus]|uniref:PorT family protein n=1 Tax=Mucilaginibacter pallidiroseus TaxID=2599295 RepID=A0A563U862_9SPHI|nr:outer membrane beta-barrel protein [Mucilaginibacter pallidiroseus]TWR27479.1 PorT family protein [Mucilaginibacter pallidiroseus]